MVTVTISMQDNLKAWIDTQIAQGKITSTSDYVGDLIERDHRARGESELTLNDLSDLVERSQASGLSDETVASIFARAKAAAA